MTADLPLSQASVSAPGAQGLVIGNHNQVQNTFVDMAGKDRPAVLVVGSGVSERVLLAPEGVRIGAKEIVLSHQQLFGGSGLNYTTRLLRQGYAALPILSVGDDLLGHRIHKHLVQSVEQRSPVREYISSTEFLCPGLHTPESTVIVSGQDRTILTTHSDGCARFPEHHRRRRGAAEAVTGVRIAAVMIGHVYSDADPVDGRTVTRDMVEQYSQSAVVFVNLGRSQYQHGNRFWERVLPLVTVFQLSVQEMREFFSADDSIGTLKDQIRWFQERSITVVITMDKMGTLASLGDGSHGVLFARPIDLGQRLVDSTGAGDAFGAGMISLLVDFGMPGPELTMGIFRDAVERGRLWAAHCCTQLGAASECPTPVVLKSFKKDLPPAAIPALTSGPLTSLDDVMWLIDRAYPELPR